MRAVRIRRAWSQADLARRAQVSKTTVSNIERGQLEHISTRALRRVGVALDVRLSITVRLPHGELDRLLNAGHAALHEALGRHLNELPGWVHAPEVSFSIYGERGVIDILAFHEHTGALLVIELKTELVSLEDLLTTMDVRLGHAESIARDRGWVATTISAWIVFADTDLNRRRVADHAAVLRTAYPADGRTMRGWLLHPGKSIRALSFYAKFSGSGHRDMAALRRRVPKRAPSPASPVIRAGSGLGGRR